MSSSAWTDDQIQDCCLQQVVPAHRPYVLQYQRFMWVLALLGPLFVYLQASQIILNESSDNVSLSSYIVLLVLSVAWLVHGLLWSRWLQAISGFLMVGGTCLAMYATVHYRPKHQAGPFSPL